MTPVVAIGPPCGRGRQVPGYSTIATRLRKCGVPGGFQPSRTGAGNGASKIVQEILTTGRHAPLCVVMLTGEKSMSFQVVRHEHPNIFVVNRQTYETYRFTVGDDGVIAHNGPPSDLGEAARAAVAFLARGQAERAPNTPVA